MPNSIFSPPSIPKYFEKYAECVFLPHTVQRVHIAGDANTHLLIRLTDALKHDATSCLVRNVDTYIIVILIGKLYNMGIMYPSDDICVTSEKSFRN